MAIKFLDANGKGSMMDGIIAIDYVTDMRKVQPSIRLSNNSWGVALSVPGDISLLQDAVVRARDAGVLFVAAAGNNGDGINFSEGQNLGTMSAKVYPASFELSNVITVAATDNKDQLAKFSNYGSPVDIAAPGTYIRSTVPFNNATIVDPNGVAYLDGTSQAAPFVAGTALLAWAKNPSATFGEIRDQVVRNADTITIGGGKFLGPGGVNNARVNAFATLIQANKATIVTGADAGGGPHVRVFFPRPGGTQVEKFGFFAYAANFTGGVRVATGDVNGDGVHDIVTVPGVGTSTNLGPLVRVWDGVTGQKLTEFYAYATNIYTGFYVAIGDTNNDGHADIITAPDAGAGSHVKIFSGANYAQLFEYFAYSPYTMGVRLGAGDVNGDGYADVISGPGPGGGPHVKIYSGATQKQMDEFFAYSAGYTGGIFVSAGDVNGTTGDEIIVSPVVNDTVNRPVKVYSGTTLSYSFAVFAGYTGGVRIGTVDFTGNDEDEIIVAQGSGPNAQVQYWEHDFFTGANTMVSSYVPYGSFGGGVFVGGRR